MDSNIFIQRLAASADNDLNEMFTFFKQTFPDDTLLFEEFANLIQEYRNSIPMMLCSNDNALDKLRQEMKDKQVSCFVFSTSDEYINEYVSACAERIKYLTKFSGSLGLCIVTLDSAALVVDGRYTLQANMQVDTNSFEIIDYNMKDIKTWIDNNVVLDEQLSVGLCSKTTSLVEKKMWASLFSCSTCNFVFLNDHIVDLIWENKVETPLSKIFVHDIQYAGMDVASKVNQLIEVLKQQQVQSVFITNTDDISWLFNIRSNELECNPVVCARALVSVDGNITIFIDKMKLTQEMSDYLEKFSIVCNEQDIENILSTYHLKESVILSDTSSVYFFHILEDIGFNVKLMSSIIANLKSKKNTTEIESTKNAHILDAVALIKFWCYVYSNIDDVELSEVILSNLLKEYRSNSDLYKGESFDAIVGVNENGAIVHYKPTEETSKKVTSNDYLLLDCGGQYLNGTTDITRTVCFSTPSDEFKRAFTLVLKGHIAVASARLMKGSTGASLDILARQYLWNKGMNYNHGTGHGVGVYACVHEGPISIRSGNNTLLESGMIISNEPGYYKENEFGIRLENLYVIKESRDFKNFLELENLTWVPFDIKCIDFTMLSEDEKQWINDYHLKVVERIGSHLADYELNWLKDYINM